MIACTKSIGEGMSVVLPSRFHEQLAGGSYRCRWGADATRPGSYSPDRLSGDATSTISIRFTAGQSANSMDARKLAELDHTWGRESTGH